MSFARALQLASVALAVSGCHLSQAISGGLRILTSGVPVDEPMVSDEDPGVRRLLWELHRIRRFIESRGLEPTRSFQRFVEIQGPAVVWVVSGSEPLALVPKVWSFPIVGSFTYRAWFDRADAERDALSLESEGFEGWVRGASAYSTLGFFDDPILSTMLDTESLSGLGDFANVVIHESVHATIYVEGQSAFNESLASFVADVLTDEYLARTFGRGSPERGAWQDAERRRALRIERLGAAYQELERVYSSTSSADRKLAEKARVFDTLETQLGRRLNNAALIQLRTYDAGRAPLGRYLEECSVFDRFLAAMKRVGPEHFAGPHDEDIGAALELFGPCQPR
ncbi:MAG: aminopeptidase [Deltaproteobacteria bacterium]|nr:aminopeptidase [Deltaproteobacteria bacterium]